MDPNTNLKELLELANKAIEDEYDKGISVYEIHRMSELFLALDEWLKNGGLMPERWAGNE